jgi:hypothetical protein
LKRSWRQTPAQTDSGRNPPAALARRLPLTLARNSDERCPRWCYSATVGGLPRFAKTRLLPAPGGYRNRSTRANVGRRQATADFDAPLGRPASPEQRKGRARNERELQAAGANRCVGPTGCGNLVAPLWVDTRRRHSFRGAEMVVPPSRFWRMKVSGAAPQSAPETRPGNQQRRGWAPILALCPPAFGSIPKASLRGSCVPRESAGSAPVCARRGSSAPELNLAPLYDAQAPERTGAELPLVPPRRPKPEANHGRAGVRFAPREARASAPEPNLPTLHDAQTRLKRTCSPKTSSGDSLSTRA